MRVKTYDAIVVDVANFIYRKKSTTKSKNLLKVIITSIEDDVMSRIKKSGTLYLLFDPIPENDLGVNKTFQYSGFRKEILPDYKKNRVYDTQVTSVAKFLKSYFMTVSPQVVVVSSKTYEADDYVEGIVESLEGSICLLTTDEDWCRYLRKNVDVINEHWDAPFTREEFKNKFEFYPTAAANILYKSVFGDKSDGITGCINVKKAKFATPIKKIARDMIIDVSNSGITIKDFVNKWNSIKYASLIKEPPSPFKDFYLNIFGVDQKSPVLDTFLQNIKLIQSALTGDQWKEFAVNGTNEKVKNQLLRESVFGVPFVKTFGRQTK